jgi:hypothetical protein
MRKQAGMTIRLKNALALALFSGLLFFSCNQDSIFYDISNESEPIEPRIKGSPTNIVELGGTMYAASIESSRIHGFTGWWYSFRVPGSIHQLAATGNHFYAILGNNTLYQVFGPLTIPGGTLQSVYGAGNRVFVGIGPGKGPYSVAAYNDSSTLTKITLTGDPISGLLKGVAWDGGTNYFVATTDPERGGGGVYWIDSSNQVKQRLFSDNVMGIIHVGNYIIAITSNGTLYYFDHTTPESYLSSPLGGNYTGAMCSWSPNGTGTPSLLLLGVGGGSSDLGYREVALDTTTGKPTSGAAIPGSSSPSTVQNKPKYEASLGKHAVYSIRQVPNSPVIFASTAKDGLWSLRNDRWNGEE